MSAFSGKLPEQAWMNAPETQKLLAALTADGGEARFVGGCVRDTLANRKVLDIDIATPLAPEDVIDRLKAHKIAYAPVGLKHGTVTAIVDGRPFEITTLRRDVMTFGRHAEVKFTDDWKTDASRRDFTINAIFVTPDGLIYDPFDGVKDLREGRVRFVGDPEKRIREDVLRILRFFRFTAHFGKGAPDAAGLKACTEGAKLIPKLSAERIRQETLKLLDAPRAAEVWGIMLRAGVVTHFLPEATGVRAMENMMKLEEAAHLHPFALRRLAAALDVTEAGMAHVVKELKLSNEQKDLLTQMVAAGGEKFADAEIKKRVYRAGNDAALNALLVSAARHGERPEAVLARAQLATSFTPVFPLKGADVLAAGIKAGPEVGMVLEAIENWWMDEDFSPTRDACLHKLKTEFV